MGQQPRAADSGRDRSPLRLRSGDTLNAQITLDGAITIRAAAWSRSAFAAEIEQARRTIREGTAVTEAMHRAQRY